jgi:hypothetical protein
MITVFTGVPGEQSNGIIQRNKTNKGSDSHHLVIQQQRRNDFIKWKSKDRAMGFPCKIVDTKMVCSEKQMTEQFPVFDDECYFNNKFFGKSDHDLFIVLRFLFFFEKESCSERAGGLIRKSLGL